MNAASLELSKQLYELSGWMPSSVSITISGEIFSSKGMTKRQVEKEAKDRVVRSAEVNYGLGYLLRKLPESTAIKKNTQRNEGRNYIAFQVDTDYRENQYADTPEDAACLLAIELFNQGVLKKDR